MEAIAKCLRKLCILGDEKIADINFIPQGFLWMNNLQRSILCVPPRIDKTLPSRFWFSMRIGVYCIVGNRQRTMSTKQQSK